MKKKSSNARINVQGTEIAVIRRDDEDFISLTDIAKSRNAEHPDDLIRNWLRNRNTLELLGIWEQLHNPNFNPVEFDGIKKLAGLNSFTLTPKQWIDKTGAAGIVSKAGRYGGTYAHRDVAFEFASWVSVEFKLYLIKEFQRLKEDENRRLSLAWNLNRTLAKINYRIHTDAIQSHLIPPEVTPQQAAFTYASEADLLNVALFGQTASQWRTANPDKDGNMRDHATLEQLLVLANLENMNAELIHMELTQSDRVKRLNAIAIRQMQTLTAQAAKQLEEGKA
ncbi:MAG: KilA-N domain-containing protein [Opitutales bacterium]